MNYVPRFAPEVEDDAVAGYAWYENKTRGLGEEFLRIFDATVAEILRHPLLAPELVLGVRRRLLHRFPYAVYYFVRGEEIIVLAFFHCARDPARIQKALRDRSED